MKGKMKMDNLPLVSVIVPVYNVEEYIDECLESIVNQSYNNLEIILVNDGSTDGSGKKCEQWAKIDSRIMIVNKRNGGLSSARNAGLSCSKGDYISFVDSDDMVNEKMVQIALENICTADILTFRYCNLHANDVEKYEIRNIESNKYTGDEMAHMLLRGDDRASIPVWRNLYKRDLIKNMTFVEGIYYEDIAFSLYAYWSAQAVVSIDTPLYYYRNDNLSITRGEITEKHVRSILISRKGVLEIVKEKEKCIPEYVKEDAFIVFVGAYITGKRIHVSNILLEEIEKEIQKLGLKWGNVKKGNKISFTLLLKGTLLLRQYAYLYNLKIRLKSLLFN